jgi:Outer membrane protein beta-barrel domain
MKKTTLIIVLLLLLFSVAIQVNAQQVHFGVKGGVNIAQLHFNDDQLSPDSKVGLNLGVLAHIHTSKTWALQPELIYSLEGAQKVGNPATNYSLNYLNIPVLLQYMFSNGFRLEGGPQIGFLLSAKRKVSDVSTDYNSFKSSAVSIPLGVGYLTSSGFGLDARYVFGLSNINDTGSSTTIQSNVFQLGIFYQLSDTKMHSHHRQRR